jgi:triosephosphate isomerase
MPNRQLIAGNWKMNGLRAALGELEAVAEAVGARDPGADVLICPPFTLLREAVATAGGGVMIGAQTCHGEDAGAFTGSISGPMIADAGAGWVIVGHSERREAGESDAMVSGAAAAGARAGLHVIVCVGESLERREAGEAATFVRGQIRASLPQGLVEAGAPEVVIAYEPIWAIGTGRNAEVSDIEEMHAAIRAEIAALSGAEAAARTRILYGGSVKPSNAAGILSAEGVDGALVGGASLKAADFIEIIKCA